MAFSFATYMDYSARGYVNPLESEAVLDARLAAASRFLRAQCPDVDARIVDGVLDLELVKDIVCAIVRRSVPVEEQVGFSQFQQTAGPFSQGGTVANPHGDFYLTRAERKSLGYERQRAFTIDLAPRVGVHGPADFLRGLL